ncbi:MAG: zf-TFIIB domain-containing protein [Fimbriimonadaceae bacterium]|nr:zf-TFIIB domain-containing protein [Fimbriimonadaceae bacterium]
MNCPTCRVSLKIAERQGIEIDYCPECRGVWLDRGELDKLIERASVDGRDSRSGRASPVDDLLPRGYFDRVDRADTPYRVGDEATRSRKPKRKESFLERVFDVLD